MRSVPAFYLATIDENNQPRVRPLSLAYEWEGKLSLGVKDVKKVYQQLMNNPNAEICAFNQEKGTWVRISGKVKLFRDIEANRYILNEVMPALKSIHKDEHDLSMVIISFVEGQADFYSCGSTTPRETIKL